MDGTYTPETWKNRVGPLLDGMTYTFVTSCGEEYRDYKLCSQDEDGVWIKREGGGAAFIAAHELEGAS